MLTRARRIQGLLLVGVLASLATWFYVSNSREALPTSAPSVQSTAPPQKVETDPRITALIERLDGSNESDALLAVQELTAFDPKRHDAFLALLQVPEYAPVNVLRAGLAGLKHFPDFESEAIVSLLARSSNSDRSHAEERIALLSYGEKLVPFLIEAMSGPEQSALHAKDLLNELRQQTQSKEAVRIALAAKEKDLIRISESSNQSAVVTSVSLILHEIGSPEAKAAAIASYKRQQAFRAAVAAAEKTRETTLQTLAQVTVPVRLLQEHDTLEFESISFDSLVEPEIPLFVNIHRNGDKAELLEIWKKQGEKYRLLRKISTDGETAFIEEQKLFQFAGETFFLVQVRYPGTGFFHDYHLYHIDRKTASLDDVATLATPGRNSLLLPDEEVLKGIDIQFDDDSITFGYGIWKKGACNACSHDTVRGSYVLEKERTGRWVMRPGEMRRTGEQ